MNYLSKGYVDVNSAQIIHGDCLEILPTLEPNNVDAIVTDPPYGLSFMGKDWDHGVPGEHFWREALLVAKPGAHLLAFGGTRTFHRLTCAIEDAGWQIRDCLGWLYGSGFPKSHNIGNGFGTALKPAWEPIILARKPLDGTVAANVQKYGTGALNIDGCRVDAGSDYTGLNVTQCGDHFSIGSDAKTRGSKFLPASGRWPANLIHDGSEEVVGLFPQTTSNTRQPNGGKIYGRNSLNDSATCDTTLRGFQDSGSSARFFYCAKASKQDRDEGLDSMQPVNCGLMEDDNYPIKTGSGNIRNTQRRNNHPTVKPTTLMRYLCRLITPPNGIILDPFMGSGSTGKAALLESFNFIGIELNPDYITLAQKRIQPLLINKKLFGNCIQLVKETTE